MIEAEPIKSKLYETAAEAFEAKMRMVLKDKATTESIELLLDKHPGSVVYKHDQMDALFDVFLTGVEVGVALQGS